jgi:hypothetical protein
MLDDRPSPELTANELHFALVIGISKYPGGFASLSGPLNDAREFADWLTDPGQGGLPKENVHLVVTPTTSSMTLDDATPTKAAIDRELWSIRRKALAAQQNRPEEDQTAAREASRLYLFGAGHGIMPGTGKTALLDAQAERDRRTNLELSEYHDWLEKDGTFGEICIFADCCRVFELLAAPGVPSFDPPANLGGDVFSLVGWATSAGGLAFEDTDPTIPPDERRGYFSQALLEGLRGNAADPETGYVTSTALAGYVNDLVTERTKTKPAALRQRLVMSGDLTHPLAFGPARTVPRTPVDSPSGAKGREPRKVRICFPVGFTGLVELVAPDRTISPWDAADGPWLIWLYDGTWVVQHSGSHLDGSGFADGGAFTVLGGGRNVQL